MQAPRDLTDSLPLTEGDAPREAGFAALADACGRAGDVAAAEDVVRAMQEAKLSPTPPVLTSVVQAYRVARGPAETAPQPGQELPHELRVAALELERPFWGSRNKYPHLKYETREGETPAQAFRGASGGGAVEAAAAAEAEEQARRVEAGEEVAAAIPAAAAARQLSASGEAGEAGEASSSALLAEAEAAAEEEQEDAVVPFGGVVNTYLGPGVPFVPPAGGADLSAAELKRAREEALVLATRRRQSKLVLPPHPE